MTNPKSARRIGTSPLPDNDSRDTSPPPDIPKSHKKSKTAVSDPVEGSRPRKASKKQFENGNHCFLSHSQFYLTASTNTRIDKDKENAQQKKMLRLQAENAKMKKKLKTSAKGQTRIVVDQN